jgi:hypothetical protein
LRCGNGTRLLHAGNYSSVVSHKPLKQAQQILCFDSCPKILQSLLPLFQVAAPSQACQQLLRFFHRMRDLVLSCLPSSALDTILPKAIDEMFAQLAEEEKYWEDVMLGMIAIAIVI